MAAVRAGHAAPVAGGDPMRFVSLVRGGRTWGEVGARASVWSEVGATLVNFAQLCSTLLNFSKIPRANTQLTQFWSTGALALLQRGRALVAAVTDHASRGHPAGHPLSHALYCKPHKDCARLTLADCALRVVDGLSSLRRAVDAQGSESMGRARAPAVSTLCQPRCAVDITRLKLRLRSVRCGRRRRAHHRLRSAALEQRLPPAL